MLKFEAILTLTDSHPLHHMILPYWLQLGKHSSYIGLSRALKEAFLKYQIFHSFNKTVLCNRFLKKIQIANTMHTQNWYYLSILIVTTGSFNLETGAITVFSTLIKRCNRNLRPFCGNHIIDMWQNLLMIRKFSIPNAYVYEDRMLERVGPSSSPSSFAFFNLAPFLNSKNALSEDRYVLCNNSNWNEEHEYPC